MILSGRRKHFYLFDIQAGKMERISQLTNRTEKSLERFAVSPSENDPLVAFLGTKGSIPLVSLDSRQVVAQLKISGSVKAATFSPDSTLLFASGESNTGRSPPLTIAIVGRKHLKNLMGFLSML